MRRKLLIAGFILIVILLIVYGFLPQKTGSRSGQCAAGRFSSNH
jgi:hypothetical protein